MKSQHFVSRIKDFTLAPTDLLVSFDVESLFTKVPIPETVSIISEILSTQNKPTDLAELVNICLTSTYFQFRDRFYEQVSGAAMGSPLSPVVASIFMEAFEQQVLGSFHLQPKCWFRYVDDTFVIWPHGRDSLGEFLSFLNSQHQDIRFTMEIESDGHLPFLDVLVTRYPDGKLGHTVYRKPTHTDRYLNALSHHHPAHKQAVINTLVQRAFSISEPEALSSELRHVTHTLIHNNYRAHDIHRTISRHYNPKAKGETKPSISTAFLPYIQGITDRIGKVLHKHNIKTIFRPHSKISDLLPSVKDKIAPLLSQGVYRIPCSCGSVYIGETKRPISVRVSEHERCIRQRSIADSALAEHKYNTGHQILFNETKLLSRQSYFYPRKFRESIEIFKHPQNFNRDDGYMLHSTWRSFLSDRVMRTETPAPPSPLPSDRSHAIGPITRARAIGLAVPGAEPAISI